MPASGQDPVLALRGTAVVSGSALNPIFDFEAGDNRQRYARLESSLLAGVPMPKKGPVSSAGSHFGSSFCSARLFP